MALSQGSIPLWSDITAIYNSLNSVRQEHSMGNITVPSNQGATMTRAQVNSLQSAINTVHNETHLSSVAQTAVTIPAVGDPIRHAIFNTMRSNITRMVGVCHFTFDDFSFGACNRCDGFRDSGGFN